MKKVFSIVIMLLAVMTAGAQEWEKRATEAMGCRVDFVRKEETL